MAKKRKKARYTPPKPKPKKASIKGASKPANQQAAWAEMLRRLAAMNPGNPTAQPAAPAPASAAPAAPGRVNPFLSGGDMAVANDFMTSFAQQLANIDFELSNLQTDTTFQKTQNEKGAKEATGSAEEVMVARGLFRSSIKDAALYDIEAQRSLQQKFLDDKLTAATLNAGTQKKLLGQSKTRFDESMAVRKVENATAANDQIAAGWAERMAAFNAANGRGPAVKASGAPAKGLPAASGQAKPATPGRKLPSTLTNRKPRKAAIQTYKPPKPKGPKKSTLGNAR